MGDPVAYRTKCEKCRMRDWRRLNPEKDTYNNLRVNARRRGVEFSLTLVHWMGFCRQTNYLELRGLGAEDMTVDRIDNYKGYVDGNIRMITRSQNSREGCKGKRPVYKPEDVPF